MDALIQVLQLILIVVLSIAPFVVLVAMMLRLRGRRARVDHTAQVFSRAAAAGVFPHSLRPPPDVQLEHEDTPVVDEMPPETLRRIRDTGGVEFPD